MRILFAEDNRRLSELVAEALGEEGFVVDCVARLDETEEALAGGGYDLLLLDLGMPDGDGIAFLRRLRRAGITLPVLIVTARNELGDRVNGLDSGADDYLAKPFATVELAARCRALLRRPGGVLGTVLRAGNVSLDVGRREVRIADNVIELSPREMGLLEILLRRAGHLVPRGLLEQSLYSLEEEVTPNAIEAIVSRLRRKLAGAGASPLIHTARGLGYSLSSEIPP